MKVAGIREVKNRLSHYLRLVAEGEVVLVSDRGTVVAQLAPPPALQAEPTSDERTALERVARLGGLRLSASRQIPSASTPIPPKVRVDLAAVLAQARADL